jgi:hypothetical protein
MRNRIRLGTLVLATSLSSGCASLVLGALGALGGGSTPPSKTEREIGDEKIDKALDARDFATLQKQCAGAIPVGEANKARACAMAAMVEAEDTKDCDRSVAIFEQGPTGASNYLVDISKKLAECDRYPAIFEGVMPLSSDGGKLLVALEQAGKPVEAKFIEYAKGHGGAAFLPVEDAPHGLSNISQWLLAAGHKNECQVLATAVTGASEDLHYAALGYFRDAPCKTEAVSVAAGLLTSETASHRLAACEVLGLLGDEAQSKKLALLAETDAYSELQEEQAGSGATYASRVYPVRDACRAAAGKIALRAQ